ncbi:hypothetical protein MATL_G00067600 [Megalops atlanticus]|uniref:Uncharacterized protein n=1 Tax=Megalops atlanticus TaxID=7932 RepID=A0A9D3Q9S4_MEGAT|nr:hypothetical protein MATL_G00067600 [Megalops atlanticus]
MPISSGATGRVGVGVDTSKMWTPDGWKQDANPLHRNCDSYLKRYLETHPGARKRINTNNSVKVSNEHLCNPGADGENMNIFVKDLNRENDAQQQFESSDGNTSGDFSTESTSNKSSTCTIL